MTANTSIACALCAAPAVLFVRKKGHDVYLCKSCGLGFVHPIPNSAEVYGEDYFAGAKDGFGYVDYDNDKKPMVPTFKKYLARIKALTSSGALLDVGAATGFFLSLAKEAGYEPHGVEISAFAAARAREKGLDVVTGTLAQLPKESRFDVVTMLDVIEHVSSPRAEIARAHELLKDKGILVINTPDRGSLYARFMGKNWHLIVPPEHLYYFTRANMRTLLEEAGFEVLQVTTVGKKFTLEYIFKTLYMWQGLGLWKAYMWLFSRGGLAKLALPINLGDNMFVLARKK